MHKAEPRAEGHGRLVGAVGSRCGEAAGRPWTGQGSRWRLRLGGKGRLPPCWASAGGWTRLLRCSNQSSLPSGGGKNAWLNWSPSLPAPILFQQWADDPWVVGTEPIWRGRMSRPTLPRPTGSSCAGVASLCIGVLCSAGLFPQESATYSPGCGFPFDSPWSRVYPTFCVRLFASDT